MMALVIDRAPKATRRVLLRRKLLKLSDLLRAEQTSNRGAQRLIEATLMRYLRSGWSFDNEAGFYAGDDEIRSISFEIMMLSNGAPPRSRSLQKILQVRKNTPRNCAANARSFES